jgi:hypothetical protein
MPFRNAWGAAASVLLHRAKDRPCRAYEFPQVAESDSILRSLKGDVKQVGA